MASLKQGQADQIYSEVVEAVRAWPELAAGAGIEEEWIESIQAAQHLDLPAS